jgi:GNAT superfamily N-acetyltransferase
VESVAQGVDQAIFLAFSGTLPIGMAALARIKEQPDIGELTQVWVHHKHRGRGAAWELVDYVFQWAAENHFHKIIAGVTNVNAGALQFYARYGFSRMDESPQNDSGTVYLMKKVKPE